MDPFDDEAYQEELLTFYTMVLGDLPIDELTPDELEQLQNANVNTIARVAWAIKRQRHLEQVGANFYDGRPYKRPKNLEPVESTNVPFLKNFLLQTTIFFQKLLKNTSKNLVF